MTTSSNGIYSKTRDFVELKEATVERFNCLGQIESEPKLLAGFSWNVSAGFNRVRDKYHFHIKLTCLDDPGGTMGLPGNHWTCNVKSVSFGLAAEDSVAPWSSDSARYRHNLLLEKGDVVTQSLEEFSISELREKFKVTYKVKVYISLEEEGVSVDQKTISNQIAQDIVSILELFNTPKVSVIKDMENLFQTGLNADISIVSGNGEVFPAHRTILRMRSNTLSTMLSNDYEEDLKRKIRFPDMSGKAVFLFLKYLYVGDIWKEVVEVPEGRDGDDVLLELLNAAEKYFINELKTIAALGIWFRCNADNVASLVDGIKSFTDLDHILSGLQVM